MLFLPLNAGASLPYRVLALSSASRRFRLFDASKRHEADWTHVHLTTRRLSGNRYSFLKDIPRSSRNQNLNNNNNNNHAVKLSYFRGGSLFADSKTCSKQGAFICVSKVRQDKDAGLPQVQQERCKATSSKRTDSPSIDAPVRTVSSNSNSNSNTEEASGYGAIFSLPVDGTTSDVAAPSPAEMFGNHRLAYASKSTWELIRSTCFFLMCRFQFLTNNAEQLMNLSRKLFGKRCSHFLIRKTVYDQFVAGSDFSEVTEVVTRLRNNGVGTLLALPMEDDAGIKTGSACREELFDQNLEKLLTCTSLCRELGETIPMFQLRGTALMSGDLTKEVGDLCGMNIDKKVLDAFVSGMQGERVNFSQLPGWESFTPDKNDELNRALRRFEATNKAILSNDVIAMMDAEYTYLNPALRLLALAMARVCNKDKPRVFYTYQAYLKTTHQLLKDDLAQADKEGVCFGAKLVRGAYMVKERRLASEKGYPDPIQETFDMTCENYHRCLDLLLERAAEDAETVKFIIATHNEDTIHYAMNRMKTLAIDPDGSSVFFGQLYGMADHVTFTLGHKKYRVYKSVPYGDIEETVPYLARRAQENKAILLNARREKQLVSRALRERLLLRN